MTLEISLTKAILQIPFKSKKFRVGFDILISKPAFYNNQIARQSESVQSSVDLQG